MFSNLLDEISGNPKLLLTASALFAAVPVAIWIYIFFRKGEHSKKTVAIIFALGSLTAPALLGLQYIWDKFPQFNLAAFIENNIQTQSAMYIAMFVLFGAMEEIIKLFVVKAVDSRTILVKNVNHAIRYSIVAALGFSFTENIYYLYEFAPSISKGELIGMFAFRSIFTMCAHMIFSGVFGYYYGIGKFSIVMAHTKRLTEGTSWGTRTISKIFNLPLEEGFRQKTVVKGLFIAIGLHATFNFLLQFNIILPVIAFVVIGFIYVKFLLSRQVGKLILAIDPKTQRPSTIAKKNKDVVVELLGMWVEQKNYVDVLHVCERLLERDPDNPVVKVFKAKALDAMDNDDPYKKILSTVIRSNDELTAKEQSILSKYTEEKEMFGKVKKMIAEKIAQQQREQGEFSKAKNKIQEFLDKKAI
ncbi:MAG: PrsW family glutamic-type intramembrane protease [bacterium]|nr:PrsW family glutamic-type intramembrane protease [bacterium]